jgi:excisionase family DNA binding protein
MKRSSEQANEAAESSALRQFTGLVSVGDAALAELHGLRSDIRELIAILRSQVPGRSELSEEMPPMMTLAEAAELLRTTTRALYQQIRRGQLPGVVRVGKRRLMVKTDVLLRGMRSMPTVE